MEIKYLILACSLTLAFLACFVGAHWKRYLNIIGIILCVSGMVVIGNIEPVMSIIGILLVTALSVIGFLVKKNKKAIKSRK